MYESNQILIPLPFPQVELFPPENSKESHSTTIENADVYVAGSSSGNIFCGTAYKKTREEGRYIIDCQYVR
jgi:hypothetical protein